MKRKTKNKRVMNNLIDVLGREHLHRIKDIRTTYNHKYSPYKIGQVFEQEIEGVIHKYTVYDMHELPDNKWGLVCDVHINQEYKGKQLLINGKKFTT